VLERFAQNTVRLEQVAEESRSQSAQIMDEVSESLVQLQFQDRVSQILAQVVSTMNELATSNSGLANGSASVTERAQEHMQRMMRSYTTDEQRRNHQGLDSQAVAPQDVTFF